ncbi:GIY-YIG nuclease family protein [Methylomarinum sp. Ch1-1]|uniref:GIY-YIG nuclease family protein n=1 Tax=Methylomarinum roseum TaxID=3067653 RepID=A0AAU7NQN7_9GAMM|nr:GIY-YIG nuclease family protein [Methylomarinum sp. Ch1-1]MDP4520775.1 GIY-YIG nuclease family protein [Methylomarinum sp. Ch1-1]
MQAATIKIFLVHGSPSGLRTAELSNWSGKAIAAPRTEISDLLKREELANPGFYLLTGVDPESGDRAIYIGEAENVTNRLKGHATKDFWNAATVFVSKDENLTKAHIRYIEGVLIERANNNGVAIVMNSASSGARLPESDAAEMDVFLEKCLQLLIAK